mgnify:CR=1 FL=1
MIVQILIAVFAAAAVWSAGFVFGLRMGFRGGWERGTVYVSGLVMRDGARLVDTAGGRSYVVRLDSDSQEK